MWLSGDHGRLIKWHPLVNFKFGELRKSEVLERKLMEEKTYQTPCGTIHYWTNVSHSDEITLVFLPGLTADHRLFDKQIQYFENRYNVIVWDAPDLQSLLLSGSLWVDMWDRLMRSFTQTK